MSVYRLDRKRLNIIKYKTKTKIQIGENKAFEAVLSSQIYNSLTYTNLYIINSRKKVRIYFLHVRDNSK